MPISGRTPEECYDVFLGAVRPLVSSILGDQVYLDCRRLDADDRERTLEIQPAARMESRHGHLFLYIAQRLAAEEDEKGFRLRTLKYWYRILPSDDARAQALIRWEYDRDLKRDGPSPARNHVQIHGRVSLGNNELDLNKLHMPTGWTTIEEVFRFAIYDLGVRPKCGDAWPDRLVESEKAFYEQFTGKRY